MEPGRAQELRELLYAAKVSLENAQVAVYTANERIRGLPSTATEAEREAAYVAYSKAVQWESVCKSTYNQTIRIAGG